MLNRRFFLISVLPEIYTLFANIVMDKALMGILNEKDTWQRAKLLPFSKYKLINIKQIIRGF